MLKATPFANALAGVVGVLYLVCRVLAEVAPDFLRGLGQIWFHSYDLSALPTASLTASEFVIGLVSAVIASWLFGYLLAWTYNRFAGK